MPDYEINQNYGCTCFKRLDQAGIRTPDLVNYSKNSLFAIHTQISAVASHLSMAKLNESFAFVVVLYDVKNVFINFLVRKMFGRKLL